MFHPPKSAQDWLQGMKFVPRALGLHKYFSLFFDVRVKYSPYDVLVCGRRMVGDIFVWQHLVGKTLGKP